MGGIVCKEELLDKIADAENLVATIRIHIIIYDVIVPHDFG